MPSLSRLVIRGISISTAYGAGMVAYGAGRSGPRRIIEAARQVGADKDEAAFKARLAQIARQNPKGKMPAPPIDPTKDA